MKTLKSYISESDTPTTEEIKMKIIADVFAEELGDPNKYKEAIHYILNVKSFGDKAIDALEEMGVKNGPAIRIIKAVKSEIKAQLGSASSKGQTQSQRIDKFLKQKWVKK